MKMRLRAHSLGRAEVERSPVQAMWSGAWALMSATSAARSSMSCAVRRLRCQLNQPAKRFENSSRTLARGSGPTWGSVRWAMRNMAEPVRAVRFAPSSAADEDAGKQHQHAAEDHLHGRA